MIEPEIENIERANKNPSGGMLMPNDDPTILNDYEKQIRVPYRTEQWKKAFGKESLRKWQYVDLAYATLTNDTNMIPFDLPGSAVEWKLYATNSRTKKWPILKPCTQKTRRNLMPFLMELNSLTV